MEKCSCYKKGVRNSPRYSPLTGEYIGCVEKSYGYCTGTKELEACSCDGDKIKCNFYPYIREEVIKKSDETLFVEKQDAQRSINFTLNKGKTLIIETNDLKFHQKDLDITIDISNDVIDSLEVININGVRFIKTVDN